MNFYKLHNYFLLIFLFFATEIFPQNFISPLNISPSLSANFGDLRGNHFHSGLDFRTQQVVNKPVFAVENGFISRINISPGGYGLALYIDHPEGFTTVYGHLNSFSKKIADYAKRKQYENENFKIDIKLKPSEIPVKKGEQVAFSGNSGGSGGPHLHFEIRDTKSEDIIDGFNFIGKIFTDTQSPEIKAIAFYPIENEGIINNNFSPTRIPIIKEKSGDYAPLSKEISCWGKIGVGIKTDDRMNGTSNTFGVKKVRLFVDEKLFFSSNINRFHFDQTRMLNSYIDFDEWKKNKSFYIKSFIEKGNILPIYDRFKNGYITINEERNYRLRYELEDYFGNKTSYSFIVKGKKQHINLTNECKNKMFVGIYNHFIINDFTLNIPIGNLYADFCYAHTKKTSSVYFSDIQIVNNNRFIPLDNEATIWIKFNKNLTKSTSQFGIVEIDKAGKEEWIGGIYKNGGIECKISELGGNFAIALDTISPAIVPKNNELWVKTKKIVVQVTDNKSGIDFYRGEIDGKFALFTHDVKSKLYYYTIDDERIAKGNNHTFSFTASDGVGNKTQYKSDFYY